MLGYDYSLDPCSSVSVDFVDGIYLVSFDPFNYLSDSEFIEYFYLSNFPFSYYDFLEDFVNDR